jgi:hypothetical protein
MLCNLFLHRCQYTQVSVLSNELVLCLITTSWKHGDRGPCIKYHYNRTTWKWVINFSFHLCYPQEKTLQYPFDRKLDGPNSMSEHGGDLVREWTLIIQSVVSPITLWAIPIGDTIIKCLASMILLPHNLQSEINCQWNSMDDRFLIIIIIIIIIVVSHLAFRELGHP